MAERAKFKKEKRGAAYRAGAGLREAVATGAEGIAQAALDAPVYAARQGLRNVEDVTRGITGAGAAPARAPLNFRAASEAVGAALRPTVAPPTGATQPAGIPDMTTPAAVTPRPGVNGAVAVGTTLEQPAAPGPASVSFRGQGGARGDISRTPGTGGTFRTPDQAPQPFVPTAQTSIEEASAEFMRRNPGAANASLDTADLGLRSLSTEEVLAGRAQRAAAPTVASATPVQRPVFEYQQVTDPVTGRTNPQKVDTGQTETVWIGPSGGEFASETEALAGSLAQQEATSLTGLRAAQAEQARTGAIQDLASAEKTTAEAGQVAGEAASLQAYRAAQTGEAKARTAAAGAKAKAPVVKSIKVDSGRVDRLGVPIQETRLTIAVPGEAPRVVRPRDLFTPTQAQTELTRLYDNLSADKKAKLEERIAGRTDLDVYSSLDAVYDVGALEE